MAMKQNEEWLKILGRRCPESRKIIKANICLCFDFLKDKVAMRAIKILAEELDPEDDLQGDMLEYVLGEFPDLMPFERCMSLLFIDVGIRGYYLALPGLMHDEEVFKNIFNKCSLNWNKFKATYDKTKDGFCCVSPEFKLKEKLKKFWNKHFFEPAKIKFDWKKAEERD